MMNSTDGNVNKKPIIAALEDAAVVGGFAALGGLIAVGYPPGIEILYGSSLAALFAGLTAYARVRQIRG